MKRLLFLICSLALGTSLSAQTQVTDYKPGVTDDGITYFLPQTQVRVVLSATKTHYEPGEFAMYAERYLRLKNVTQKAYDVWTIDNVALYTYGVADKTKAYSIKLKHKTSAPLVSLAPDGRLLSINAAASESDEQLPQASVTPIKEKVINGADCMTEEILSAGSVAKMAELTANEIYDIRENRGLLNKSQADFMPKDGEQLKLMLANLDEQETGLLQLFRGTHTSEKHVITFDVAPKVNGEKQVVCNFSKYLGAVDADDPAGIPLYITVTDLNTLPAVQTAPNAKAKKEVEDVRYVVPGRAQVRVFNDEKELASQSFPMAQCGRVEHLGGELFNKKNTTHVQLSGTTGGIVKIDAERPQ